MYYRWYCGTERVGARGLTLVYLYNLAPFDSRHAEPISKTQRGPSKASLAESSDETSKLRCFLYLFFQPYQVLEYVAYDAGKLEQVLWYRV